MGALRLPSKNVYQILLNTCVITIIFIITMKRLRFPPSSLMDGIKVQNDFIY